MTADKKQFLVLLAWMGEAFKEEISKDRAKIYYEFLKGYPIEKLRRSFECCIASLKFFPRISEIIEFLEPKLSYDPSYWPTFKDDKQQIEYQPTSREEAKSLLGEIQDHLTEQQKEENEQRKRAFVERKKLLEEQRKKIMEGMN